MTTPKEAAQARALARADGTAETLPPSTVAATARAVRRSFAEQLGRILHAREAPAGQVRTHVRTDTEGNIVEVSRGHLPLDTMESTGRWERITDQRQRDQLLDDPLSFKRVTMPDGTRGQEKKPTVRITIDTAQILANGIDAFQAMVVGPPGAEVKVEVFGSGRPEIETWTVGQVHSATSVTPGETWSFRLKDPRYHFRAGIATVTSVAVPVP